MAPFCVNLATLWKCLDPSRLRDGERKKEIERLQIGTAWKIKCGGGSFSFAIRSDVELGILFDAECLKRFADSKANEAP